MYSFSSKEDIIEISSLGRGSFGQVKKIHHRCDPNKIFALKVMPIRRPSELKYILQEIELHKSLSHPNIIQCYDYFVEENNAYVVLEFAPKGDLYKYRLKHDKMSKEQILKIYTQILLAFQYIHSKNILHRDLKPENILIDENDNPKICDFGWSAKYREDEKRITLCGTAEYMAPEVIFKEKQTKRTDVWALGKIL